MSSWPPCGLTQERLDEKKFVGDDQKCRALVSADGGIAVCGWLYTQHKSTSSVEHKSPPPPPKRPPTSHIAVIDNSELSKDEKAELKNLCGEAINLTQAERIGVLPINSGLTAELRSILEFIRKKYKSPPVPTAPPLTAPSAHVAVVNQSALSKEEKSELIGLCGEKVNWGNAEAIAALPNTSTLTNTLRGHLEFLRKKYQTPPAKASSSSSSSSAASQSASGKKRGRPKQTIMRSRVKTRNKEFYGGKFCCDICGDETDRPKGWITSHIIADAYAKQLRKKASKDPVNFYDSPSATPNGLFCCRRCDELFEDHEINIDGDGTIHCSKAIMSKKESEGKKYSKLNGTKVAWADQIDVSKKFPTSDMLKWRKTLPAATSKRSLLEEFGIDMDDEEEDDEQEEAMDVEDEDDDDDVETAIAEELSTMSATQLKDAANAISALPWLKIARKKVRVYYEKDVHSKGVAQLAAAGLMEHDVGGRGNCTFRSIADQLEFHGILTHAFDHAQLRQLFRDCCENNLLELAELGIDLDLIENFGDGEWQNDLADVVVFVLARAIGVNIRVVNGEQHHDFDFDERNDAPRATVVFANSHYRSTRPASTKTGQHKKSKHG